MMQKTISIDQLVRPNIKALKPYSSAREKYRSGLLLDANENSYGSPFETEIDLNRYPNPGQELLRDKYAEMRNIRKENIFVGNGSDEAIDLIFRIFCEPGKDRVILTPPTYGMYKVSANIHNTEIIEVPLDSDFQPVVSEIRDLSSDTTKLLFLCSPNNPTGNCFDEERVEKLAEEFSGIIVLDEAYIDFSDQESFCNRIVDYPNLVVLQTMSKSFGLAGIRLGIAIASEPIIEYFLKVKPPYNVNSLTSKTALRAMEHVDRVHFNIDKIREERDRLFNALSMLNFVDKVYPSDANFLLFKLKDAFKTYQKLAEREIIVRYRGDEPGCENCLRVTVGTPEENDRFLSTLKNVAS